FSWPISSCARSRRPWNSSGVMGCTRSPSGCKEEKLAGACVSAVDPGGTPSVIAEAAAAENRKLRREISCVVGFSVEFIGKEGWLLDACNVKNLGSSKRRRIAQRNVSSPAHCHWFKPMRYFANADCACGD